VRIVHVNTEHTWRGGESQVFNLMRGLRGLGHEVEAVTLPGSALMRRCRDESLPVIELPMRSDADLAGAFRLARHLKRHPCDVLHAQTARAHSIGLLARRFGAKARLVVSRRLDFPVRRNLPNRWKYRSTLVDAYIAVAEVIRGILIDAGVDPARVTVINSSIELGRFTGVGDHRLSVREELRLPPDAPVIGNVAALAWHKGQKDLIAAMPHVLESLPEARLVIVGGGDEEEALRSQAAALNLEDRIRFTGMRHDVPRLLTAFDVFCMPSYLEGLCNSVLEAFAMKVPVVATRAGGLPEIVEHERTGLLAPPRDPASLAAAIVRMLSDRALAERVGDAGHRLVHARFSVDHMVARTVELYERISGSGAIGS
jgi:L-malate glycosyltransferase